MVRIDDPGIHGEGHWTGLLRPGDLVVAAQGVGEPSALLECLLSTSPAEVELFVGLSHSEVLTKPSQLPIVSFGGFGPLSGAVHRGNVEVIPAHFDDLPRVLPQRGQDIVVLIQVTPADASGSHGLGMAVDHTFDLLNRARVVIAEVNDQVPVTSAPRVPASTFDAVVHTSRPLPVVDTPEINNVHRQVAAHVADLIPDGATVQLGIGAMASAVGVALREHRGLAVRSTLAGDWLLDLASAGCLRPGPDAVVISEAAGSPALYDYVSASDVQICPVNTVSGPAARGEVDHFVAINSALQVDLSGQVNAEEIATGYIGGIGGQAEYLRAAQRSTGGRSMIALPATAGRFSRIVTRLDTATVTTPRSGVDFIVTEYGVADLRGRSLRERAEALIAIAAPHHRDALQKGQAQ
ncbi:acetyl-CoA hydrolase/transferase family protein [Rhodococcus sp. T7]|uniref:acetyl-CoA hydrolase/transferase family protein n=1 Tax=Rhodococcus sp. T7 TaxID=627444 RepID=UPI001F3E3A50|nr:acetyl-CoA hydrolase/transferase C-terminal domain-containing protein [Rhodococcus sp. T7]